MSLAKVGSMDVTLNRAGRLSCNLGLRIGTTRSERAINRTLNQEPSKKKASPANERSTGRAMAYPASSNSRRSSARRTDWPRLRSLARSARSAALQNGMSHVGMLKLSRSVDAQCTRVRLRPPRVARRLPPSPRWHVEAPAIHAASHPFHIIGEIPALADASLTSPNSSLLPSARAGRGSPRIPPRPAIFFPRPRTPLYNRASAHSTYSSVLRIRAVHRRAYSHPSPPSPSAR
ncbi:hypothetical protein MPTK1_1g25970 [Marchantia polymorpha subsp. ruderalis]|uniref:Uncharacterized protein n=2 Tax=Marchantia polymorpha TaxID=3197 RepID=A0AAF6AUD2_MARPO|nr:hypothetical protein MARPO_0002s0279 [Marchantia polymorpha]BBN00053.1 hypothetical protein Mp_1g25970 [Marchantia polymorpha subsp. ruderalis]|eukprot:PTQ49830.1 hypothetical protein MARPO_0002s0279 [Marchantia polymorpha]